MCPASSLILVRMRSILFLIALVAACLGAGTAAPSVAIGHEGAEAFILVPLDQVNPGEPFEVIGADLTPNSSVSFRVERGSNVVPLGSSATAGPDGHFTATLTLPAEYPTGYAQLIAAADDGTETSTWILVGPRDASTGGPPGIGTGSWWTDPLVLILGVFITAALAAIVYVLMKRRRHAAAASGTNLRRRRQP